MPELNDQSVVVPQAPHEDPNVFNGEAIRTQVNPFEAPDPAQAAADLAEYDAAQIASAPSDPKLYPDVTFAGQPAINAEVQAQFKPIAHAEGLSVSEWQQFLTAVSVAERDAGRGEKPGDTYNAKSMAGLRKTFGDDTERQLGFARAEAQLLMSKYPQMRELLSNTLAGSSEFVVRILAARGERRAARR